MTTYIKFYCKHTADAAVPDQGLVSEKFTMLIIVFTMTTLQLTTNFATHHYIIFLFFSFT